MNLPDCVREAAGEVRERLLAGPVAITGPADAWLHKKGVNLAGFWLLANEITCLGDGRFKTEPSLIRLMYALTEIQSGRPGNANAAWLGDEGAEAAKRLDPLSLSNLKACGGYVGELFSRAVQLSASGEVDEPTRGLMAHHLYKSLTDLADCMNEVGLDGEAVWC